MDLHSRMENQSKKKKIRFVFLPFTGMGHLMPTVELVKNLLRHHNDNPNHHFTVTILIISPTQPSPDTTCYISSVQADSTLDISFHYLPPNLIESPSTAAAKGFGFKVLSMMTFLKPHVKSAITDLRNTFPDAPVAALIVDMFCIDINDVMTEMSVPCYVFFTSSASCLGLCLYLPTLMDCLPAGKRIEEMEKDTSVSIHLPGFSSSSVIPPIALPYPFAQLPDRTDELMFWQHLSEGWLEVNGIIVNSCEEIQPYSIKALEEGLYLLNHPNPPMFPVGPLLSINSHSSSSSSSTTTITITDKHQHQHECIQWLDEQPSKSVAFLCFGSTGSFSTDQVREIANGLERSGHRFLWVLRHTTSNDAVLDHALPQGFLERTKERGMVWARFAPQTEILDHPAVGGFVTHCGWNSVMESLWFGVPMLAWPRYAEQHFNAFEMVVEMEVALGLKVDRMGGNWVVGEELERGVNCLMEEECCERSKKIRHVAMEMRKKARKTLKEGGSSYQCIERLLEKMALVI